MLTDVWGLEATENNEPISTLPSGEYIHWDNAAGEDGKGAYVRTPQSGEVEVSAEVPWYYRFVNGMNSTLDGYFYDAQDMYNNPGKIAEAVKNIPRMVTESLPRCEIVNSPNDMSGGQSIGSAAGMSAGDIAEAAGEAVGELLVRAPLLMASGAANAVKQIAEEAVQKGAEVVKGGATEATKIGFNSGTAGESYLASLVSGSPQEFFKTSLGNRFIDQLSNGIAHESKVGYTVLSTRIKTQILKDVELIQSRQIKASTWHFFRSSITGKIGPSKPLQDFLTKNGINFIIYK